MGDYWFDPHDMLFTKDPTEITGQRVERSFVTFCLDPVYKIYVAYLGESESDMKSTLKSLGVHMTQEQLRSSTKPLLRMTLSRFMKTANCGCGGKAPVGI
jgi:116 kDa U5 small nuclear ribonucleoprotein component